jgi:glucose-1-phosphate adenylyltransferase
MHNEMVAMILAGGRGSRLYDLTTKVAKPAVYFGGKYRIIDFPLSNCANSNVSIVGVLTQYESVLLSSYVSHDSTWGLDGRNSGVFVLSPREKDTGFGLYRGTADAITQNIDFIDQYQPDNVLILSGDHIYKMDYDKMLQYHKANNADATIAVLQVTMEEAKRFGIMNVDEDNRINEFEEKPANPKSDLASMGIYIFKWSLLRRLLMADAKKEKSSHDFGKDIIPSMLKSKKRLFAYRFKGYWKDVGTIESLWRANMDLLDESNVLKLDDPTWKIYTEDIPTTPQFIGSKARIKRSLINQGCVVNGAVENSVLFRDVVIKKGARISDAVIMPQVVVEEGAIIRNCIVAENMRIPRGVELGDKDKVTLISRKSQVKKHE